MKASFDGARINLANAYNKIAGKVNDDIVLAKEDLADDMNNLRAAIGGLLCMHDPKQDDDCNEIDIELVEVD